MRCLLYHWCRTASATEPESHAVSSAATDPAAAFLAAEQENLGSDLGFDLGLAAAPAPENGLDGTADFFGGGSDNPVMDNVSNSSPNLGGVGDLAAAPSPAAGFGLEEQSSIIPSMPTLATSEPV